MKQICLLAGIILLSLGAFMGLEGTQTELSQTSSKSLTGSSMTMFICAICRDGPGTRSVRNG